MDNLFARLDHIGVIVKDMDSAKDFYGSLGVESFVPSGTPGRNKQFHGKPLVGGKTVMEMGQMGSVGIQVTQPLEPPSMSYEFLEKFGEGINHIAFIVDDIKEVTERIKKMGCEIIFSSEYLDGGGEIYANTGRGWCIQLFEPTRLAGSESK